MKRLILLVVLVAMATVAHSQVLVVDGSVNPSQIPTQQAYSAVMGYMADTLIPLSVKDAQIGFTNPQDLTNFENQINSGDLSITDLQNSLSATGWAQFNVFSLVEKRGMQLWQLDDGEAQGGGTPPPSAGLILAYYRMTVINFQAPNQQIAWFGSATGYDEPQPLCSMIPPTSTALADTASLLFDSYPPINGSINGVYAKVSGVEPGTGNNIQDVTFTFAFTVQYGCVIRTKYLTNSLFQNAFFGAGSVLDKNLSGASGYGCFTQNGVSKCDYNVAPSCTNTPTYSPSIIEDGPPGLAGWWVTYRCFRFYYGFPWDCFTLPGAALKTTDPGPQYCTNP